MRLSERGAIRSAIADGGFHLYPAGLLLEMIKAGTGGEELKGDFVPQAAVERIEGIPAPGEGAQRDIFEKDRRLLCTRLSSMQPDYDIESVFDRMMEAVPAMAKRYYGLDNFEAPRPKVVEYYFEGIRDLYRDADWFAFNVNHAESREMDVPVGTYFKRDQVAPGMPEYVALHEANHAMQDACYLTGDLHYYIPWFDEGMADAFGRIMLFRATHDEELMAKVKNFRTEVDVTDSRKVTYHYGEETAAMLLMRGRLPFVKALMQARRRDPFAIDWNSFARKIKSGWDPHIAVVTACNKNPDQFRKKLERDETSYRKDADLDQMDLRVLGMFLSTNPPATLPAEEYRAALWFADEVAKRPCPHRVDPHAVPSALRGKLSAWSADAAIPWTEIPEELRKKAPQLDVKVLIREDDVPEGMRSAAAKLAASYFVLKREIGGETFYEPYGGGLPYRLGTGEIRCSY
ncbi:MAG TPA: hypothetical protein PLZ86_03935 [bacterium]|nr:hypothetical protein [bacterium]